VPELPCISNPELFFSFHQAVRETTGNNPQHGADYSPDYQKFKKSLNPSFLALCKRGDAVLRLHCIDIIREFFGEEHKVIQWALESTVSNDNWKNLSDAYKLDRYVRSGRRDRFDRFWDNLDKFWGDVWEAWWGALFLERKLWNDNEDDLVSCLRILVWLQHYDLIRNYGKEPLFGDVRPQNLQSLTPKVEIYTEEVRRLPISQQYMQGNLLGYRAKINPTSPHYIDVSMYSQDKERAISNLYICCTSQWIT
jgi:hypothetical protein